MLGIMAGIMGGNLAWGGKLCMYVCMYVQKQISPRRPGFVRALEEVGYVLSSLRAVKYTCPQAAESSLRTGI